MDLFNEPNLIRDMQKELDAIIQQGVVQLTRLLRNSETGVSSGAAAADEDEFAVNQQKQSYFRGFISIVCFKSSMSRVFFVVEPKTLLGKGRLTERLLAQGILTPNMLNELKKEWDHKSGGDGGNNDSGDDEPHKPTTRRKRKFK